MPESHGGGAIRLATDTAQLDSRDRVAADPIRARGATQDLGLDEASGRWASVRNGMPVRLYDYRGQDIDVMEELYGRGYQEPGHWSWEEYGDAS